MADDLKPKTKMTPTLAQQAVLKHLADGGTLTGERRYPRGFKYELGWPGKVSGRKRVGPQAVLGLALAGLVEWSEKAVVSGASDYVAYRLTPAGQAAIAP